NDDEDEEMTNAKVEESGNANEENTDAAKTDPGKTEEVKDDAKKAGLPPRSSSLSVSSALNSHIYTQNSFSSSCNNSSTPPSISTIPPVLLQTITPILTPPITTDAPTITTTVPKSNALSAVQLRGVKLEKDVSELKKIDHSTEALATLKSQVPMVVEHYIGSKIGDDLQKKPTINLEQESEKSASEIYQIKREQVKKQKMPKYTINSTNKVALKECDQKSALYQTMHENKSFNKNPANHALMDALIEDENAMDKVVADTVKNHKRQHNDDDDDDDENHPAGPNQGKKIKRRRTKSRVFQETIHHQRNP
nr:hypothetical protein [Tanacetum cinerariifolium]